jgi:hypothetical protein
LAEMRAQLESLEAQPQGVECSGMLVSVLERQVAFHQPRRCSEFPTPSVATSPPIHHHPSSVPTKVQRSAQLLGVPLTVACRCSVQRFEQMMAVYQVAAVDVTLAVNHWMSAHCSQYQDYRQWRSPQSPCSHQRHCPFSE